MGATATSEVEARLRQALAEHVVRLHYQPIVTLPSARPVAVEALARWTDPSLGEVPPDSFIPVAEATGMIHTLGNDVLGQACRTTAAWPNHVEVPLRVSVNVSPLQLSNDTFVWQVAAALEESGLEPNRLVLEITESAALEDMAESAARLHALRSLGVRVALDDFGVGHSPLNMLRQLPLDVLKIDRSFVSRVHENARDAVIARLLIDTAHTLGLSVCGEGVETREQARQLMALGCDTAQGWYFGRPEPPSASLDDELHPPPGELERRLDISVPAPIQIGSDELVTIADPEATILYASPGSLAVLGYTPSELINSSAGDHLHPEEAQEILATKDAEVSERASVRVHRARHRNGTYRWLNTRTQLLRDQHGRPHQVVSTSRDVTPQVDAELQLASTAATLRWAFDQSPIGQSLSDFDGVIVRCNQAFAGMLGYRAEEVAGRKVSELTYPPDLAADAVNLTHLLDEQHATQQVDKRYVHADGHLVAARVWATTLADEDGDPAYVVAHILPMETP
ncbi:EAL domain-containing protein [Angustibacter sp. McL0619]|uniref:EAL domain-containing protein n=1 Tax=Angustibacter sp. McL0619 TaxID=3415676 RepID=UPI003CEEBCCF